MTLTPLPDAPSLPWREVLAVRVVGLPKAQPRPRAFARRMSGGKFSARMYDAGTAEAWKADVARAIEGAWDRVRLAGPVRVEITFLFPRPQSLMRKKDPPGRVRHAKKPDRDNCEKAVLDCLTQLGMWTDDGQVCDGALRKFYAAKDEQPGAEIRIAVEGGQS